MVEIRQNVSKNNRRRNRRHNDSPIAVSGDIVDIPGLGIQGSLITEPVGIAFPPDYIFKITSNRVSTSEYIWGPGQASYIPTHAEYIKGVGNFVYYKGDNIPPSRTVAVPQQMAAIDSVKRFFIQVIGFFYSKEARFMFISLGFVFLFSKKRRVNLLNSLCERFQRISHVTLVAFYMQDDYYSAPVKEVRKFAETILTRLGVTKENAYQTSEIIGCMFEYDNAYRWRLQDMLTECNPLTLYRDFPGETKRILALEAEREEIGPNPDVPDKFKKAVAFLTILWKIPWCRRIIREAISGIYWENIILNHMDIYHSYLYASYNVQGKKWNERIDELKKIHGDDEKNWPPRIIVMQKIPKIT